MISRKIVLPTLLLSLVAGLGVPAEAAKAQSAKKKPASAKSSGAKSSAATSANSKARRGSKKVVKSSRKKGQQAPTTDRINEIQSALAKNGSYSGEPSGKWDDSTVSAIRKFQSSRGLNPTGRLDAPTLQKLGLGSTTAGVAAPQAPPGAVSRLTSSKFNSAEPASEDQR